jgi:tetrahydromethanopterin S-methyltransferase subunit G
MSNDPTQDLPDEADRTTQPTITAVFELVRELKQGVDAINARLDAINARLDATNARLDEMEGRHARDFAEMKAGFIRLEDKIDRITVHSDAEYHDLRRRMRDLESKAS